MCGIAGFTFSDINLIRSMNCSLVHRGPDGMSDYVDEYVSLGHARLSIIDLTNAATQPMFYRHKGRTICIVFNGEIYNYLELKSSLIRLGYAFSNSSDTEVIMAAYIEYGEKLVYRLNGMWAFCIYDLDTKKLVCSRDRLGVKPFYYYLGEGKFIFSSELKAILKHENLKINRIENIKKEAINFFFSMGFIPAPYTIYKNISKLEAGTNLIYDLSGRCIKKLYKYYIPQALSPSHSDNDLVEEGKYLLKDAVKLRMRSDVPVGAFLSGGLDSSSVVGEMRNFTDIKKLHTFSIGFDEKKYDESNYIHLVKDYFNSIHHHHIYTERDFTNTWSRYSEIFDEPFGDYSSFPSLEVCRMAKKRVTVVLSGDGGDEIFGGYPIYNTGHILQKVKQLPVFVRTALLRVTETFSGNNIAQKARGLLKLSLSAENDFYSKLFTEERYKPEIFQEWSSKNLQFSLQLANENIPEALRIYDLLFNTLPDNFLVKVDRTSMANSVEVRSPFLDYRFVEFAQKIPTRKKVGIKQNKIIMREVIKEIVPAEIINRNKMGFTPPIYKWLDIGIKTADFYRYVDYLNNFDPHLRQFYIKLIESGKKSYMDDLYRIKLAIFGKWFEYWILNEVENKTHKSCLI